MDTSEQYIKMCEKAWEIQELDCKFIRNLYVSSPEAGTCPKHKWIGFGKYCRDCGSKLKPYKMYETREGDSRLDKEVWLLRQDQLQDMLIEAGIESFELVRRIYTNAPSSWAATKYQSIKCIAASPEQALLQLLYHEKYNKVWNSEDWEVDSGN